MRQPSALYLALPESVFSQSLKYLSGNAPLPSVAPCPWRVVAH